MRFTKSIRWRLLIWIALFLSLILAGLDFAASEIYYSQRVARLDDWLRRRVVVLSSSLYPPVESSAPVVSAPSADLPLDEKRIGSFTRQFAPAERGGFYFAVWFGQTEEPFRKTANLPPGLQRPEHYEKDNATYLRTQGDYRQVFHTTERGETVLIGGPLAPEIAEVWQFAWLLLLGSAGFLAFCLGGTWLLVSRALRPVEKISLAARRIADGNLSERINTRETDSELGGLAGVLNNTFARLETAFAQQRRFTADAAHELRTPITVLISEAQTTLARDRSASEYHAALAANLDAAQQMRRLTDSLLELARFDGGLETLHREPINLAAAAADCVKFVQPLADARRLRIRCELESVEVSADAGRLRQVITNLLTNAVRYNRDDGEILMVTRAEDGVATLHVADTGPGITEENLPRLFERFYRGDQSRSTEGNGLGLAICKAIVVAHGGTIEAASEINAGTTFTVRLPQ